MMKNKISLQKMENHVSSENISENIFFKTYIFESSWQLSRDGIFDSLFNKIFDPTSKSIPHLTMAKFELFKDQSLFYKIQQKRSELPNDKSTFLLVFNLHPEEVSLEILNDFLVWFSSKWKAQFPKARIVAFYQFNLKLNRNNDQKYLLSSFQLIQKHLGALPDSLPLIDLEKQASFENVYMVEAGTQWACLDNYLAHLFYSKGGQLIPSIGGAAKLQVIAEEPLSPFHTLQILQKENTGEFEVGCDYLEDIKQKDFFKHPEELKLFHFLSYKNLFDA